MKFARSAWYGVSDITVKKLGFGPALETNFEPEENYVVVVPSNEELSNLVFHEISMSTATFEKFVGVDDNVPDDRAVMSTSTDRNGSEDKEKSGKQEFG